MNSQGWIDLARILIWPLALVLLALIFRQPLSRLLVTLTHLQFREVKIDFGRKLEQLTEIAHRAGRPAPGQNAEAPAQAGPQALSLPQLAAQAQPVAGVLLAWSQLETQLRSGAPASGKIVPEHLWMGRGLPPELEQLLLGLQALSEAAAGGRLREGTLTQAQSLAFAGLVETARAWLGESGAA